MHPEAWNAFVRRVRREKSLKTLLLVQGQSLAPSAEAAIELKPHDCWAASNMKPQGPMVRPKLSDESRTQKQPTNYTKSRRERHGFESRMSLYAKRGQVLWCSDCDDEHMCLRIDVPTAEEAVSPIVRTGG